jgi:NAD(P)-dependent dehydrogenase (short-subunit alcohol dehydrogenase family)
MSENFKNKSVLVTGGGSGMGKATATYLASLGAKVALLDLNAEQVSAVAKQIEGLGFACDVTDENQVEQAIDKITEKHGDIALCVNCAGIAPGKRVVGKEGPMPLSDFKKAIDINLVGTFNVSRLVAYKMSQALPYRDEERGVIIHTASIAAFEGQIGQAAYSASKGGIVGMTLPMARELARFGIRVVTIAPGIMATPMMEAMPQNVQDDLAAQMPFPKRLGQANEFAKLVAHIVENQYLNGTVIRLDAAIRMV